MKADVACMSFYRGSGSDGRFCRVKSPHIVVQPEWKGRDLTSIQIELIGDMNKRMYGKR